MASNIYENRNWFPGEVRRFHTPDGALHIICENVVGYPTPYVEFYWDVVKDCWRFFKGRTALPLETSA